ncbi:MAG: PD-(D/E)XK nuclease family protein [Candidatus Limnocylindria bacterium]
MRALAESNGRGELERIEGGGLVVPRRLPLRTNGTRLETLSISSLALFWRCPERWRRRYLEREREPQSGAMIVGKAVGAAITQHYAAQMACEALSAGDADDICAAEFDESALRPGAEFGEDDVDELREHSRGALRAYLSELAPQVRPVSVERKVELRFAGAEWAFVGYLDLEDESGVVIDVKVGKKHVTDTAAMRSPQATSYLLARVMEGRPAERFAFHSVRRGAKRGEHCLVVPTERSEGQLRALEERIAQTARQIARCAESGEWPLSTPDGWWCSGRMCAFWASCPAGGGRIDAAGI